MCKIMVYKCSAPGCANINVPGCEESFHSFPKETTRCQKWIRFCGLQDRYRVARDVPTYLKMCSKHFKKGDCYSSGARRFLSRDAVPSIYTNSTLIEQETSDTRLQAASPTYSQVFSPSAMLPDSLIDLKMEVKDDSMSYIADLKMDLQEEFVWPDETSSEKKFMPEDHEMNTKVEIKDEPNRDNDLYDELQDLDLWVNGIYLDFSAAESPRLSEEICCQDIDAFNVFVTAVSEQENKFEMRNDSLEYKNILGYKVHGNDNPKLSDLENSAFII